MLIVFQLFRISEIQPKLTHSENNLCIPYLRTSNIFIVLGFFLSENRTKPKTSTLESPNSVICVTWHEVINVKYLQFCIKKIVLFIPV